MVILHCLVNNAFSDLVSKIQLQINQKACGKKLSGVQKCAFDLIEKSSDCFHEIPIDVCLEPLIFVQYFNIGLGGIWNNKSLRCINMQKNLFMSLPIRSYVPGNFCIMSVIVGLYTSIILRVVHILIYKCEPLSKCIQFCRNGYCSSIVHVVFLWYNHTPSLYRARWLAKATWPV